MTETTNYAPKNPLKVSAKIYDDEIHICQYLRIVQRFKYYDEFHKIDTFTGTLYPWTYEDTLRHIKSQKASARRAYRNVHRLSELNTFTHFLTVTFPRAIVDARDAAEVERTFKNLCKRLRYCFGEFEYLSVPEFHSDGEAIHVHVMCRFGREPKLQYKGVTKKGHAFYTFHKSEKFKRSDVFLTVEKLTKGNNVDYLTKYMLKDPQSPFTRRYACSRGLKRPVLTDIIRFDSFPDLYEFATGNGFKTIYSDGRSMSFVAKRRDLVAPDLSSKDTKGEKNEMTPEQLADWFYDIIAKHLNAEKIRRKIRHLQVNPPEPRPRVYVQDSFFHEVNL